MIKNVTLPTADGTTQIDHIVVSEFGIFVIETKNMKGWIYGSEYQKLWTQKIFKYTGKFQNPLHQNYKHTQTLASCLDIPADLIYSVVVFIGDSTFKTKVPDNVTYAYGCVKFINSKTLKHFSQDKVKKVIKLIESGRLERSLKTNFQHKQHVQDIANSKITPIPVDKIITDTPKLMIPMCKKCGSTMILREAKKGKNTGNQFWGCSNFPKCREIVSIA